MAEIKTYKIIVEENGEALAAFEWLDSANAGKVRKSMINLIEQAPVSDHCQNFAMAREANG